VKSEDVNLKNVYGIQSRNHITVSLSIIAFSNSSLTGQRNRYFSNSCPIRDLNLDSGVIKA